MELSWTMKLRIAAAAAVGVVLVGIVAWPWGSPPEPFGSILVRALNISGVVTLFVMAFLAGLIAYFAAWPYGREIGILAVPFGLAVWAIRAGSTGALMQLNPALAQRQAIFATLRWEPIFWLLVVMIGFAGVQLGQRIQPSRKSEKIQEKARPNSGKSFNEIIALVFSVLIAEFCIKILAQDVVLSDRSGSVVGQPPIGQIVFAVFVSFGVAAFVIKRFLNVGYLWPILGSSLITAFSITIYGKPSILSHVVEVWPAVFFPDSAMSVLPVQMVCFGTIGSIAGYWMALRYQYWRKHEFK
jgi:hypothetical protein